MTKLESIMPTLYRDMHAAHAFLGDTWKHHLPVVKTFFNGLTPILDYGCGPTGGLAEAYPKGYVIPYDPYVTSYHAEPWTKEPKGFFSCDVFEHMTIGQLRWMIRKICKLPSIQKIYIALSTRSANKTMPNGMNAHLTVHAPDWWRGFFDHTLTVHFNAETATADLYRDECVFTFTRIATGAK